MNSTQKVIIQQLENEGVHLKGYIGYRCLTMNPHTAEGALGEGETVPDAVDDAISSVLRIGNLLAKLKDSLPRWEQGTLGDLLVGPDEVENPGYQSIVITPSRVIVAPEEPGDTDHGCIVVSL